MKRNLVHPISYKISHEWNTILIYFLFTLGRRNLARETGIKRNRNVPQRLLDALVPTKIEEAHFNDNGKVPGDHLGAVGFDSFLYSYVIPTFSFSY